MKDKEAVAKDTPLYDKQESFKINLLGLSQHLQVKHEGL